MKQKLALSCALMHDPQLLILDEPTTGVDPLSRQEFWGMLKELKESGVSIFVSTPYMEEAQKCDYVYMMHKGRIISEGTPSNVTETFNGILYEFEIFGKKPQEYMYELIKVFPGNPVYMSGKKVHMSVSRGENFIGIETKSLLVSPDMSIRNIVPELEDIFIIKVLSGRSDEGN